MSKAAEKRAKASFQSSGWEYELAEALELDVEIIENLEGARLIVEQEACPGYYDCYFPNHYNEDGSVIYAYALSSVHIKI